MDREALCILKPSWIWIVLVWIYLRLNYKLDTLRRCNVWTLLNVSRTPLECLTIEELYFSPRYDTPSIKVRAIEDVRIKKKRSRDRGRKRGDEIKELRLKQEGKEVKDVAICYQE
jgi:hypothetical protein